MVGPSVEPLAESTRSPDTKSSKAMQCSVPFHPTTGACAKLTPDTCTGMGIDVVSVKIRPFVDHTTLKSPPPAPSAVAVVLTKSAVRVTGAARGTPVSDSRRVLRPVELPHASRHSVASQATEGAHSASMPVPRSEPSGGLICPPGAMSAP